MKSTKFSLINRIKSFGYAFNGLRTLIIEEHNARIHLLAAVIVSVLGIYLNIDKYEWIILTLVIASVFICELINSSIENLSDFVSKERQSLIKKTKDLAAGAVLLSSIAAVIIGLIIFLPKLI